jgi:heptosyltransferase I
MVTKKILICRLSAIGDCLETLPLAYAIKSRWPNSEITWVVDCGVDSILKTQPGIDRVIRVQKGFLKRPKELWRLRAQLHAMQFDFCIDPQGLLKSAIVGWLSGAKYRIGFAKGQAREQAWRFYHVRMEPNSFHLVDRQLELLEPLGIVAPEVTFGWHEPSEIAQQADFVVRELGWANRDYYVVNPGAGWESRQWSVDRYRTLTQQIFDCYQLKCMVLWGNEKENNLANAIVAGNHEFAQIAPPSSLMLLSGLIRRSRFFVGSDSGPMHLAASVGTPCVAMFGTTRAEYSGPYGIQHRRIQKRYEDGSSSHRRQATNSAMMEIEVDDVVQVIHSLQLPSFVKSRMAA